MQTEVLAHCDGAGDRFAILDSLPNLGTTAVLEQRRGLTAENGALYYPWIRPLGAASFVPPCGHVAAVYARTDQRVGVHKAPANEVLEDVLDVELDVGDAQQAVLNPAGVNCLRSFPGRGIRVWGARTLHADPAWRFVSVRRLVLTTRRWLQLQLLDVPFEPNEATLWARIRRELTAYCEDLRRRGALLGASADEAYFVRCDQSTNAGRDDGEVVAEVGLAAAAPNEFVVVSITFDGSGVSIADPGRPV
jgi:phage tail sheath protein FI